MELESFSKRAAVMGKGLSRKALREVLNDM